VIEDLIYDIGMHNGNDTAYYLYKGYRVIAIEANPVLVERAKKRFADEINNNRLTILNVGISDKPGTARFYVNNAESEWSAFNFEIAKRGLYACSGILFNHESPLRPERFVTQKIVRAARRIAGGSSEKLVLGNVEIERDWGWAPEYVEAIWKMLQQKKPDDYVIATGVSCKLKEFVEAVFELFGLHWEEHVNFNESLLRPSDIMQSRALPAKAQKFLGWGAKSAYRDVARLLVAAELDRKCGDSTD
jgi:GDP-mannose 4,6-dehydratase